MITAIVHIHKSFRLMYRGVFRGGGVRKEEGKCGSSIFFGPFYNRFRKVLKLNTKLNQGYILCKKKLTVVGEGGVVDGNKKKGKKNGGNLQKKSGKSP